MANPDVELAKCITCNREFRRYLGPAYRLPKNTRGRRSVTCSPACSRKYVFLSRKNRPTMRRPCDKCNKYFLPSGKFTKLCNKCNPTNKGKKASPEVLKTSERAIST